MFKCIYLNRTTGQASSRGFVDFPNLPISNLPIFPAWPCSNSSTKTSSLGLKLWGSGDTKRLGWSTTSWLRGPAFPSNNGNKDKVNELLEVNGKHYGNTYIYKMDSHFISLSILSFQDFVLRSLCSMKVSHPTTACFGMLDVHCHEFEDRIAWLCQ